MSVKTCMCIPNLLKAETLTAAPLRQSGKVFFIQRNDSLFIYQIFPSGKYGYDHRNRQQLLLDKLTDLQKREGIKKTQQTANKQGSDKQTSFCVHKPLLMQPGSSHFLPLLNAQASEAPCDLDFVAREEK